MRNSRFLREWRIMVHCPEIRQQAIRIMALHVASLMFTIIAFVPVSLCAILAIATRKLADALEALGSFIAMPAHFIEDRRRRLVRDAHEILPPRDIRKRIDRVRISSKSRDQANRADYQGKEKQCPGSR